MSTTEVRNCEDALRLLAAHIDRELDASTQYQVERHLEMCRSCFSRAEFEQRLKESIAALAREPVRPELVARVHTLVRTFSAAGGQ
jgi:anti-sigma factor (TIGR02949 family)